MSIPLFKPHFSESCRRRIVNDVDGILASGKLMMGEHLKKLESRFSEFIGMSRAVSVNTCTTALTICLKHFGAESGEVLVPSGSFITSVSSIIFAGGKPVLVDMDPETLSFDLEDLERKTTSKTRGIVWVHLCGNISRDYEKIIDFAKRKGLFLIEDCAHALGSRVNGRMAGSLADAACFSFYPTKIITSGTGGMITTNDPGLAKYAEKMRIFCRDPENPEITCMGNDWFMDEIRCCVARHHLAELPAQLERRAEIGAFYESRLAGAKGISLIRRPEGHVSSHYQFPVFTAEGVDHGALIKAMKEKHGVQVKTIYRPTHEEVIFRHLDDGTLEKTSQTLNSSVCLPVFAEITDAELEQVAKALLDELQT